MKLIQAYTDRFMKDDHSFSLRSCQLISGHFSIVTFYIPLRKRLTFILDVDVARTGGVVSVIGQELADCLKRLSVVVKVYLKIHYQVCVY